MLSARFKALQCGEDIKRPEIAYGKTGNGFQLFEQPIGFGDGCIGPSLGNHFVDILFSDVSECVGGCKGGRQFFALSLGERIAVACEAFSSLVAFTTSVCEAHIGIDAKRNPLLLTVVKVLVPPQLRTRGTHLDVETAPISALVASVLRFERANCHIRKTHH